MSKATPTEGDTLKISTRRLALSALLLAADILLTRLLAINTTIMKIGLGFAAVALCAMLYGAAWSALVAALADFVGAMLFPTGAYFPGFTLTAALTGLIFGLCLYRRGSGHFTPLLAASLNTVLVSFIANTALISFISGSAFSALLAARSVQLAVMLPMQALVLYALTRSKHIRQLTVKYRE